MDALKEFIAAHFELAAILAKVAVILNAVLLGVGMMTWLERKVSAWLQDRVGPNRVGPFGLLQFLADGIKFIGKEEIIPAEANKFLYNLAPLIAVLCGLSTIAVIPLAPAWHGSLLGAERTVEFAIAPAASIGLLWVLSLTSAGVYAIMLAGWASNSKYPQLGGLRSTAQIISYELAMGLAIIPVIMKTGSLQLSEIVRQQANGRWNLLFSGIPLLGFLIFLTASFAETNRLPFDLPEGEAELVGGYHTEYSGMKFASFFMAEYASMIAASLLMSVLFLGGWDLFGVRFGNELAQTLFGAAVLLGKAFGFLFFFIWVRWTLPRFRYDQLMKLGWLWLLPLAMANLAGGAVFHLLFHRAA